MRTAAMQRNIVVGIDGTWNAVQSYAGQGSNVAMLLDWADKSVLPPYYFPGVGSGLLAIGRTFYGMMGRGTFDLARQAWRAIHSAYQPGDRIFILASAGEHLPLGTWQA
ncbi:hypothetical protein E1N52_32125 [Paraburkholderia guartelaensis]|uniref:T6SS Phospholipase effector Tle1-like catalytic domain-containing protein n=1 Tax=Paraburkholderia guartelaensis TaxID=2546446 RepID=A0A4R5L6R3_9BURK|nr:hypothetical protein E1N52_32125 [Paraburkholderia guartelaensis]